MFPLLLGALAGGALGMANNAAQRKAQSANMMANAEAIRMSPWTGQNPGMMNAQPSSFIGDVAGGAMGGAMFGQQFGKAAGATDVAKAATQSSPTVSGVPVQNVWAGLDNKKKFLYGGGGMTA